MLNKKQLNITAREIADYCDIDIRTVARHVHNILEALDYKVNSEKTHETEVYGEFQLQRLWSPSGRLNHMIMNYELAEMLMTRLDVLTAYKLRKMLNSYRELSGVILHQLCNRYGAEAVAETLIELGIISEHLDPAPGKTHQVALNKLKNSGGEVQAYFIQVPDLSVETSLVPQMKKSIYFYGETAYQILEHLSGNQKGQLGEITL